MYSVGDAGVRRRRCGFTGWIQGADVHKCEKIGCKAFPTLIKAGGKKHGRSFQVMGVKVEGLGINRGEVYREMGKYEKGDPLQFVCGQGGQRWWRKPVDESQWCNSERGELQCLPLHTNWLSTCFSLAPPFWIETL